MTAALLLGMAAGTGLLLVALSLRSPAARVRPIVRLPANIKVDASQYDAGYGSSQAGKRISETSTGYGGKIRGSHEQSVLSGIAERIPFLRHTAHAVALYTHESKKATSYLRPSLTITETSIEALCMESISSALACFVVVPVVMGLLMVAGIDLPIIIMSFLALASILIGGFIPVAALLSDARQMRDLARRTVSSYIDLVVLCLAGGMGIEGALHAAADVGDSWFYARIRQTLRTAKRTGGPMWKHIGDLGEVLELPELVELSVVIGLASSEGAHIRTTLSAKAASMRKRELAEAETRANRATERLFLPSMLLLLGFLIFIGYPATTRILGGL
jgi:Flp pilus assembly protein TadB